MSQEATKHVSMAQAVIVFLKNQYMECDRVEKAFLAKALFLCVV